MAGITTRKNAGRDRSYLVLIDGKPTNLVIEKGEAPKYRMPQYWSIGIQMDGFVDWLINDQGSKASALETIRRLLQCR